MWIDGSTDESNRIDGAGPHGDGFGVVRLRAAAALAVPAGLDEGLHPSQGHRGELISFFNTMEEEGGKRTYYLRAVSK